MEKEWNREHEQHEHIFPLPIGREGNAQACAIIGHLARVRDERPNHGQKPDHHRIVHVEEKAEEIIIGHSHVPPIECVQILDQNELAGDDSAGG